MLNAAHTQHYSSANDFFELFGEEDFDEQHDVVEAWYGLVKDGEGGMEIHAKFVFDDSTRTSGTGYIA